MEDFNLNIHRLGNLRSLTFIEYWELVTPMTTHAIVGSKNCGEGLGRGLGSHGRHSVSDSEEASRR